MFGDDNMGGIEDLFNRLTGGNSAVDFSSVGPDGRRTTRKRMQRDVFGKALLDKITTKKNLHFVFDFAGKEDVYAEVKDELIENDYGETVATGKKVLEVISGSSKIATYPLSKEIKVKGYETTFKNGILEVTFKK